MMMSQTTTKAYEIFRQKALCLDKRDHVCPGVPANQVRRDN